MNLTAFYAESPVLAALLTALAYWGIGYVIVYPRIDERLHRQLYNQDGDPGVSAHFALIPKIQWEATKTAFIWPLCVVRGAYRFYRMLKLVDNTENAQEGS